MTARKRSDDCNCLHKEQHLADRCGFPRRVRAAYPDPLRAAAHRHRLWRLLESLRARQERPENAHGIAVKRGGKRDKFHHVNSALAILVFRDEGLRASKPISELLLSEAGMVTRVLQRRYKRVVIR